MPICPEALRTDSLYHLMQNDMDHYQFLRYSAPGFTLPYTKFTGGPDILLIPRTNILASISVEEIESCKNQGPIPKLKAQVMANMVCSVGNVMYDKLLCQEFTKESLRLKQITCYGVLLGVCGHFGVSKLVLDFDNQVGYFADL